MKNIHIIPTDKPSRLYFNINDKEFQICEIEKTSTVLKPNRQIYITSDEKIKEGDWFIAKGEVFKCTLSDEFIWRNTFDKFPSIKIECRKIILTTDQDLIGVQAIDDEFLEWFVRNPSCEEIDYWKYMSGEYSTMTKEDLTKCYCGHTTTCDCGPETLEEVRKVERSDLYNKIHSIVRQIPREDVETDAMDASSCAYDIEQLFYKLAQERSYSEEEVNKMFDTLKINSVDNVATIHNVDLFISSWKQEFKKK